MGVIGMPNSFLSFALLAIGLYLFFGAALFFKQASFIYYPERALISTPRDIGLDYQDITFRASDGVQLHGWLVPASSSQGTILFCHGNGGNISHRLETIELIHRLGYSIFIFDYRGYGLSDGSPGEQGTYLDVEAAWNHLVERENIPSTEIILFGRSLGGSIAAWLCSRKKARACIIESSFSSAPDMASSLYPFFPTSLLCRFNYNTAQYVKNIHSPLLVIHSPDDDIVPFNHGEKIFSEANEPKTFLEISGSHNSGFLMSGKWYEMGLENFLINSKKP